MAAGGPAVRTTATAAAALCSESHPWASGPGHPHSACAHPTPLTTRQEPRPDAQLLASLCLFAHNNTQPLDGEGAGGRRQGGVGGEEASTSLASPLCAWGGREGGDSPLPPECKQQQMNKNKNTKGRRKVPGTPPPLGSSLSPWRSPRCPTHQSCLSPRGCPVPATSPAAESGAQNCWASSSHR